MFRLNCRSIYLTLLLAVTPSLFAEGTSEQPTASDEASARLKYMKDSVQVYEFTTGNPPQELKLISDPALRWTNPVSNLKDGTLFFWTSQDGRPYAAAQAFVIDNNIWLHEFQSLTTEAFTVQRENHLIWSPTSPGVEWKPVPGAPIPAKSPTQRLTQMKAIVDRFGANDDFEGKSRWELRPLTKPLLRYTSVKKNIVDGATFAFVHTTDPEVFLMLEVVGSNGQDPEWRYALAPMTAYALKVSLDNDVVWEKPWIKEPPITAPYKVLVYKP